jgi:hypothetical protein
MAWDFFAISRELKNYYYSKLQTLYISLVTPWFSHKQLSVYFRITTGNCNVLRILRKVIVDYIRGQIRDSKKRY